MKKIAIIGGGFAGTMTAVNLIDKAEKPFELVVFSDEKYFNKGIAYNPYSKKHLLNVITAKMSAFPELPDHFLEWVTQQENFANFDKQLIANSFLPRYLYGEYLTDLWQKTMLKVEKKGIKVNINNLRVKNLEIGGKQISLGFSDLQTVVADYCVIATGNQLPGNPQIKNTSFFQSNNYYRNPWEVSSVSGLKDDQPVLIIGNGLTMVDTVIGLLEHNFKGKIYSLSPNGFNILPHRNNTFKYGKMLEELYEGISLAELVLIVKKHCKLLSYFGLSPDPVIDSLRPYTQKIWRNFSLQDKKTFMKEFRHSWGNARHRIPPDIFDKIQNLIKQERLFVKAGKIIDLDERNNQIEINYFDFREQNPVKFTVSRVINCTGPETDLLKVEEHFLKKALQEGVITQDPLKLGIITDVNDYRIFSYDGQKHPNLFTLGSNLKGELWESTAVNELREQSSKLAEIISKKVFN